MKATNVEEVLGKTEVSIIGIGVTAFNRLGPEIFLPKYRILCLSYGQDLDMIEEDIPVFSIERSGGKFSGLKNSSIIMENELVQKEIEKIKNPYLLFYMPREEIRKVCDKYGWNMIGQVAPEYILNKLVFRKTLENLGIPLIPGEESVLEGRKYPEFEKKYGSFVVQLPEGSGGKTTWFIRSGEDFEKARIAAQGSKVLITKLINGSSPSITGCVTKYGIVHTNLQYQLLDIYECMNPKVGSGVFCGHDWTSSDFTEDAERQAYEYIGKVGEYLKSMGYRGIFGLDLVLEKETQKLYIVECNPRLLGSFPILTMVQEMNGEPHLIAFHIAEFLDMEYDIDVEEVNRKMCRHKTGAQLVLYNKTGAHSRNRGIVKPGVYVMENDFLAYRRPGYRLSDLKEEGEFILADDVPFENSVFKPHERIMRIITLHPMIDKNTYKLNGWAKRVVEKVYFALEIEPVAAETSATKS